MNSLWLAIHMLQRVNAKFSSTHFKKCVLLCGETACVGNIPCCLHISPFYCEMCIHCKGLFVRGRRTNTHLKIFTSRTKHFPPFFSHYKLPYGVNFGSKFNTTGEHKLPACLLFLCWWNVIWCSCRKPIRGRVRRRRDQEEDVSRKERQTSPTTKNQATLCATVITTEHTI